MSSVLIPKCIRCGDGVDNDPPSAYIDPETLKKSKRNLGMCGRCVVLVMEDTRGSRVRSELVLLWSALAKLYRT